MTLNRQILLTALLLVAAVLFFGMSSIDTQIQNLFYNTQTQKWILDRNLQPYRLIFYDGIKAVLIGFALLLLGLLVFARKKPLVQQYRSGILIVVLSAIIIPFTASTLKKYTNMPCPKHSTQYGGIYPHVAVWEHYPNTFNQPNHIQCWPAGHASGGFALLSLFFLFRSKKNRKRAIFFALAMGWVMGGYKMLIGDHYFSHTLITMLLSWLLILIIAKAVSSVMPLQTDIPAHP